MAPSALALRLEARALYESAIEDSLRSYPDAVELYQHHFRGSPFVALYKRRRILLRPSFWPMLHAATAQRRHWIRDPDTWVARGHTVPRLLWSLIDHLYCRYTMPRFWLAEWMRNTEDVSLARLRAFVAIAQGESPYALSRDGRLGYALSRKECHALGRTYGVEGLGPAVRMAQVVARSGTRWLGHALGRSAWGPWPDTEPRETRRSNAIGWLCRQPGLTLDDVNFTVRVVDGIRDLRLQGRTMASLRAHVAERRFARRRRVEAGRHPARGRRIPAPPPSRWEPTALKPLVVTARRQPETSIRELCTLQGVHQEGRRLSHCVASYAGAASRGECSLWSLRVAGLSMVTIEVRNGAVVQIRGQHNRAPTQTEMKLVRAWMRTNELRARDC